MTSDDDDGDEAAANGCWWLLVALSVTVDIQVERAGTLGLQLPQTGDRLVPPTIETQTPLS